MVYEIEMTVNLMTIDENGIKKQTRSEHKSTLDSEDDFEAINTFNKIAKSYAEVYKDKKGLTEIYYYLYCDGSLIAGFYTLV